MLIAAGIASSTAACLSRPRLFVTSYMRDHKIKSLCKIVILVAGLVLVSAEKSETRRFETKIKTKTRGFETKTETNTKQTGLETILETKTSLETSNTAYYVRNHTKAMLHWLMCGCIFEIWAPCMNRL